MASGYFTVFWYSVPFAVIKKNRDWIQATSPRALGNAVETREYVGGMRSEALLVRLRWVLTPSAFHSRRGRRAVNLGPTYCGFGCYLSTDSKMNGNWWQTDRRIIINQITLQKIKDFERNSVNDRRIEPTQLFSTMGWETPWTSTR